MAEKVDRRRFLAGSLAAVGGAVVSLVPREAEASAGVRINTLGELNEKPRPLFSIYEVADTVPASTLEKTANELTAAPGDVIHKNETLLGTEHWLAEPGNRTLSAYGITIDASGQKTWSEAQVKVDLKQEAAGACWLTSEYRETFTHDHYPFLIPEGGFVMITGAGMDLSFPDRQSEAEIHLGAQENHSWIVVFRGLPRDYKTPLDRNVMIDAYNMVKPGAVNGTRLPPGQYFSEAYFQQNVAAAHGRLGTAINCGTDGCSGVSALFFDVRTGAYSWVNQGAPGASWELVQTNLK